MKRVLQIFILINFSILIGCGEKQTEEQLFVKATELNAEQKFEESLFHFQKIVGDFPNSKHHPKALFMIGFISANNLNDSVLAKTTYEKFLELYPEDEMATSAKFELKYLGKEISDIEMLLEHSDEVNSEEKVVK